MNNNKSSLSKARDYTEIGEFWDKHDLTDYWDETTSAEFEVDIQSEVTYYAVDNELSEKIRENAQRRGISPDTLLNLWLQEKLQEQVS
jgi:predicted HicB family RNase H-like nuclease